MRESFISTLTSLQNIFGIGISLSERNLLSLADYYELILEENPLLHLVAPCSPEEFATRHILESLTLLPYLPENAVLCDVGTGAGLPSIPCLIVRQDLGATLIESKEKKTKFLGSAIVKLGLSDRTSVVNRQFEETTPGGAEFVACRALDKFADKLPRLIKWSRGRTLLFFGGPALRSEMERLGLPVRVKLMPLSEKRYLFVSEA